uniref:Phototropic-responsive NPH3 family protein n=1 Tax=Kalanchoe fedtschenkoi TaxID=63787 RepID=A0A7N0V0L5_KALFE
MKFMKLGTKPDAFHVDGNFIRHVSSDLETDVVIKIDQMRFHLHKFPLLSKSNLLQELVSKASEEKSDEVAIPDFPGGPEAFEICAKFCYGIAVTLSAYNVVAARCAAEYLEMTEDVERGNLVFKVEVFLNSSVFHGWKDSIIVLQTCRALLPWSEDLNIVGRCVDSVASKTSMDPAKISWSYTHNRRLSDKLLDSSMRFDNGVEQVPKDWWVEDVSELEVDLFKRLMVAVKSKGRMDGSVIEEALRTYALRWLPESADELTSEDSIEQYKYVLETIFWLLPSDKAGGCSCKFLLKLLKVGVIVGLEDSLREGLVERISLKLDEAPVKDLLIPARSRHSTSCDVELVHAMVSHFIRYAAQSRDLSVSDPRNNSDGFVLGHGSLMRVGRLVDGYLAEIAHDPNLSVSEFVNLSQSVPDTARAIHDGLYMAIDIYLKEHPSLTKQERRKICGAMDVKKLSMEASIHAAQNDRLPLRVIVQVLFFEQIRAAAAGALSADTSLCTTASIDGECENSSLKTCQLLENQMCKTSSAGEDDRVESARLSKSSSNGQQQTAASRSMRMFSKLWIRRRAQHGGSETTGSSPSPTSTAVPLTKSCNNSASSSCRRYSVS